MRCNQGTTPFEAIRSIAVGQPIQRLTAAASGARSHCPAPRASMMTGSRSQRVVPGSSAAPVIAAVGVSPHRWPDGRLAVRARFARCVRNRRRPVTRHAVLRRIGVPGRVARAPAIAVEPARSPCRPSDARCVANAAAFPSLDPFMRGWMASRHLSRRLSCAMSGASTARRDQASPMAADGERSRHDRPHRSAAGRGPPQGGHAARASSQAGCNGRHFDDVMPKGGSNGRCARPGARGGEAATSAVPLGRMADPLEMDLAPMPRHGGSTQPVPDDSLSLGALPRGARVGPA